jgi:hypothetical protein
VGFWQAEQDPLASPVSGTRPQFEIAVLGVFSMRPAESALPHSDRFVAVGSRRTINSDVALLAPELDATAAAAV